MYSNKYDQITGRWTGRTYTLLKRLGAGGIGEIYLVQDAAGALFALKISTDLISITKEYRFLCSFKKKSFVPRVYDLDDFDKQGKSYYFFTMEFIQGYNLKSALNNKSMHIRTKLTLMCVIIRIIMDINAEGFIYTDLKHENIMIDGKNGMVRLVDFGSLVKPGSTIKEYTPMYDRLCWGKGRRLADKHYQTFVLTILLISMILNRSLDPNKEKLELVLSNLRKRVSKKVLRTITLCIDGQIKDCEILYNEISCSVEERFPDSLKSVLNILIAALALLVIASFALIL